ncbi:MAG: NfeD family protein [Bacteroidota bacterium]
MSLLFLIALILVGIILLVLEILMLPGLLAGIAGVVLIMLSLAWAYIDYGTFIGNVLFASTLALTIAAVYGSLKSRAWNRFGLKDTVDGRVNDISHTMVQVGDKGTCVSALRPSGTVEVNGHRIEANTNGIILNAGTQVEVLEVLPGKVIVKEV